jgi:hypothetical protein
MYHSASFAAHLKTLERTIPLRSRYENFIGGQWIAPAKGAYFDNISPTTGQVICQIARSQAEDVELAIDAGHAAADKWGRTSVTDRARILNRIADRMEEYLPFLAAVETYDNGKPIRETNLADMPLAVDHFRYFAGCIRAQEGSLGELDDDTVAYHSLEFSDFDGRLEIGTGAGRRQLRGTQTGRADTAVHPGADGTYPRFASAGCAQCCKRLRA